MVKKPAQIPRRPQLDAAARGRLAAGATYIGSAEHKVKKWWGGLPGIRVDRSGKVQGRPHKQKTTICHLTDTKDKSVATGLVQSAIRSGRYRFTEADDQYPKHVWFRADGQAWFGFCINSTAGTYKGWPLEQDDPDAQFD